jgi:DNA polymerase I
VIVKRLLLVDFNNLFYKAMNVQSGLTSTRADVPIMGAFGFIKQFCETINDVKPTHVVICNDAKPYIRSKLFPAYKQMRRESDEERVKIAKYNRHVCEELLDCLGLPIYSVKGYEADDLIATAITHNKDTSESIIIASTDSDLVQLLKFKRVYIRRKYKGKVTNYGRELFLEEYGGMNTNQYVKMLAIAGTHNSVPGIKNFGLVKARNIVQDDALYNKFYAEHKRELDLYIKLIRLPITEDIPPPEIATPRYVERDVARVLIRDGIELHQRMHSAFKIIGG